MHVAPSCAGTLLTLSAREWLPTSQALMHMHLVVCLVDQDPANCRLAIN
jgi:hypothetical protein